MIRDGAPRIVQNKTGARPGIEITGELVANITKIDDLRRFPCSIIYQIILRILAIAHYRRHSGYWTQRK